MELINIIKCPECDSKDFDIHDMEYDYGYTAYYAHCYCEECDVQFDIEYKAVGIKLQS